jgi:hypothetical protein
MCHPEPNLRTIVQINKTTARPIHNFLPNSLTRMTYNFSSAELKEKDVYHKGSTGDPVPTIQEQKEPS